MTIVPIAGYDYVNIYCTDVTATRKAVSALRESEEIFNQFLCNCPVLVYIKDENLKLVKASNSFEKLLGKPVCDLIGKDAHELLPTEFAESVKADDLQVLNNGLPIITEESFGGRIYTTIKFPVHRGDDKPVYLGGFTVDITELKKARDIMEKYNRQLEEDVRQRTAELSEKNSQLQQEIADRIKAEQTLKAAQSQLIESEKMVSIGRLAAGIAHELNTPLGAIGSTQTTLRSSFDRLIHNCQKIYRLPDADVNAVKSIIEQLLIQSSSVVTTRQRREIIKTISDELAGKGIENSQEIAQFLLEAGLTDNYQEFLPQIAGQNGDTIRDYCSKVANITQGLQVIDSAINQSSRIAFALREYARTDENRAAEMFDVSKTLETAIILYGNKIKHGIDLNINFAPVPCITGYPNELCQVWTNLIHNAVQAMDGVGRLEIDLQRKENFIVVSIKDSGCGIAPEIIEKIFDPLFTTKPVGIGTGLGLDIARRIVQRHGGTISAESQPGMGATFIVQLPISM